MRNLKVSAILTILATKRVVLVVTYSSVAGLKMAALLNIIMEACST